MKQEVGQLAARPQLQQRVFYETPASQDAWQDFQQQAVSMPLPFTTTPCWRMPTTTCAAR
jgi:hypothetical protein